MSNQFFTLGVPFGSGVGPSLYVGNLAALKSFIIQGSYDGQLLIEGSENGINFAAYLTFTGGAGAQYEGEINAILQYVRVRRQVSGSAPPSVTMGGEISGPSIFSPPFVTPLQTQKIYVRPTGNDTSGDGTSLNPFLTIQRANQALQQFGPPGVRQEVDHTGVIEDFAEDYVWPALKSAAGIYGYDFADPFFYIFSAFRYRAEPRLASALTPAEATILAVNGIWNPPDPNTGLASVTDPTQAWIPGSLKGLLLAGVGGPFENATIYDNTATTIFFDSDGTFVWTFPLSILEQSSKWNGFSADPFGFDRAGFQCSHQDSLVFCGVDIGPGPGPNGSPMVINGGRPNFEGCNLRGLIIEGFESFIELVSNNLDGCQIGGGPDTFVLTSRLANGTDLNAGGISDGGGGNGLFFSSLDGAASLGKVGPGFLIAFNFLIDNAPGDGLNHLGLGVVGFFEIRNSGGNGILAQGPVLLIVIAGVGAGNAGVGIRVMDGAQVRADFDAALGPTLLTGIGGDQEVGNLGAAPYPAAPANIPDFTGPTATGARLFTP